VECGGVVVGGGERYRRKKCIKRKNKEGVRGNMQREWTWVLLGEINNCRGLRTRSFEGYLNAMQKERTGGTGERRVFQSREIPIGDERGGGERDVVSKGCSARLHFEGLFRRRGV